MGEKLQAQESEEIAASPESRWGDVGKILEIMNEGEVTKIMKLEDILSNVSEHANEVDYAEITPPLVESMSALEEIEIQLAGLTLKCIFKPGRGEDKGIITKCTHQEKGEGFKNFYPREAAAYLIDRHFGFDVIPPTVIRNIPGEGPGSLRLYVDPELYDIASDIPKTVQEGEHYQSIAALDWLMANWDRKSQDYFYRRDDPKRLVAIDNAYCLMHIIYSDPQADPRNGRGPHYALTYDYNKGRPRNTPLPEHVVEKVKKGLEKRDALQTKLVELGIPERDISAMWKRAEVMLSAGKYLSRLNTQISDISFEYKIKVL